MKNKTKSVLAARRNRYGYVFIVPWIIGFILFFPHTARAVDLLFLLQGVPERYRVRVPICTVG